MPCTGGAAPLRDLGTVLHNADTDPPARDARPMNILLLGSGGREHALAWKIAASPLVEKLYCAPGNAGIAQECELVALDPADPAAVIAFCRARNIGLVGTMLSAGIRLMLILAAPATAVLTAVVFSVAPARRAARLDPVQALSNR